MNPDSTDQLGQLADLIRRKNEIENEIAQIIGRPALVGHVGEYIASVVFGIRLEHSAAQKGIDGKFAHGPLTGKSVNVKWYGKMDGLLDINPKYLADFYLVMAGPKSGPVSSREATRPWVISSVYLFESEDLLRTLNARGVRIGTATSVPASSTLTGSTSTRSTATAETRPDGSAIGPALSTSGVPWKAKTSRSRREVRT